MSKPLVASLIALAFLSCYAMYLKAGRSEARASLAVMTARAESLANTVSLQSKAIKAATVALDERTERLNKTETDHAEFMDTLSETCEFDASKRLPAKLYDRLCQTPTVP